jgi:hypothetical protein
MGEKPVIEPARDRQLIDSATRVLERCTLIDSGIRALVHELTPD